MYCFSKILQFASQRSSSVNGIIKHVFSVFIIYCSFYCTWPGKKDASYFTYINCAPVATKAARLPQGLMSIEPKLPSSDATCKTIHTVTLNVKYWRDNAIVNLCIVRRVFQAPDYIKRQRSGSGYL